MKHMYTTVFFLGFLFLTGCGFAKQQLVMYEQHSSNSGAALMFDPQAGVLTMPGMICQTKPPEKTTIQGQKVTLNNESAQRWIDRIRRLNIDFGIYAEPLEWCRLSDGRALLELAADRNQDTGISPLRYVILSHDLAKAAEIARINESEVSLYSYDKGTLTLQVTVVDGGGYHLKYRVPNL